MDETFVDSSPTQSSDDSQESSENSTTGDRRMKRREKNREAAQRSRQKMTARADELHKEYENLEKENRSLVEEIKGLKENVAFWEKVCKEHESKCFLFPPDLKELGSLLHPASIFSGTGFSQELLSDLFSSDDLKNLIGECF
ncbi:basic leucine zipper transcriptional factor ATF-like 2 [Protopterus annectens]|uniref:basic leucine zipper transcriptional factor ATF-like 2 n=1 Tax=Protopterus annectens TaxID=7888 RepID=UPI001CFACA88|nr:basic leucine zipper transcriptional factor ATF-like 2 [Protopterus annectens]